MVFARRRRGTGIWPTSMIRDDSRTPLRTSGDVQFTATWPPEPNAPNAYARPAVEGPSPAKDEKKITARISEANLSI